MTNTATAEQVSASSSALQAAVAGIPTQMTQWYLIYGEQTYETDMAYPLFMITFDEMLGSFFAVKDAGYDHFQSANTCTYYGPTDTRQTYVPWRTLYKFVKSANDVIAAVDSTTTDPLFRTYRGYAHAFRAFNYFMLTSMYEPVENQYTDVSKVLGLTVPIVTEKTTEVVGKNNPRAPHDQMISFILSDLDAAEAYLDGVKTTDKHFPGLPVVYGLKAKVYLLDGKFADAERYARLAIDNSGCTPLTQAQWEDPQTGFNSENSAWMWKISYLGDNMANLCNYTGWVAAESNWGYAALTGPGIDKALYDWIPATDFRKHSWLDPAKTDFYDYKTVRDEDWLDEAPDYLSLKFRCVNGDFNDYTVGGACDVPLMRVEEMYYIEAEAKAQQDLADGVAALNDFVKKYRNDEYNFNAQSLNAFNAEYINQLKVEFWGEGVAFHEAKRLKVGANQAYAGNNAPGSTFQYNWIGIKPNWNFCIPVNETQNNKAVADYNNPDPSGKH